MNHCGTGASGYNGLLATNIQPCTWQIQCVTGLIMDLLQLAILWRSLPHKFKFWFLQKLHRWIWAFCSRIDLCGGHLNFIRFHTRHKRNTNTGLGNARQGSYASGKCQGIFYFFKVRELSGNFMMCQGKMKFCHNVRELSGKFAIPVMNAKKRAVLIFGIQAKLFWYLLKCFWHEKTESWVLCF